ncbi:site-2 protease family protein [Methanobacterium ferruginis]|uniref:site-2 protease family protein n=1 Tax=Methanobacterium ferruginis TaxID=710191 RepID=UPI0025732261|nr:site-2 protease family protein [Methanobacterium ferruginis]BDZ67196.1 membrane-associated Zn-dependent protease [Methanobacterium ferruginis]
MNVLWYYVIFFVSVYIVAILFRNKLKVDVYGPILMRRTKKMRGWIDSIANLSPRFWRWSMNIGIPIAVFCMGLMVYMTIMSLQVMFETPTAALLLPGVDIPGSPVFIPIFSGILALIILMVVHEFGHGILARVDGVGIKSIGVILLAILPGAFVELDEEDVEKAKRSVKLRIYAAGSMFNLGTAAIAWVIVIILSASFIPYAFESDGFKITSVTPGGPSEGVLKEGMIVHSINGYPMNDRSAYTELIMNNSKPGDQLTYVTDQGTYTITTTGQPTNESITYPGTRSETHLVIKEDISRTYGNILPWFLYDLAEVAYWVYLLNLLVGLFNLLPMKPLDGGIILEELLGYKLPEKYVGKITYSVSMVLIGIVAVLVIYGTVPGILKMF